MSHWRQAIRRIEDAKRLGAARLDLSYLNLTKIPESVAELHDLHILHLDNNQITEIPDSVDQLAKLEHLFLFKNQITAIPNFLARLPTW